MKMLLGIVCNPRLGNLSVQLRLFTYKKDTQKERCRDYSAIKKEIYICDKWTRSIMQKLK